MIWSWRDDIPLVATERIRVENVAYHTEFSILNVQRNDTGKYKLKATNRNGSDEEIVELVVLGRPSTPKGPLDVKDVHDKGCKLKWKKPVDDGGVPIKEYEIEKMDTATGKWVRVGRVPASGGDGTKDEPEFAVTGLSPGAEYKFRVSAVNDEGESEPLVTEQSIVAKNPYDEPLKPGTPEVVDWDNKSVKIKWKPPKSDGGATIEKYVVERKDTSKPEWEKTLEVPGDQLEAVIEDLKETGEYQFRVTAINKAGLSPASDPSKTQVIRYKALKPRIDRTNLKTVIVRAGKPISFDVDIRGEPPPTVIWLQKDQEVKNRDGNVEIANVPYNTKFNIKDSVRSNTGMWKIKATNQHGEDVAEVDITVLSAPGRPKGPLKVTDVTKNACKIKWQKPDDDGGKPITAYQVEKMDKSAGRWVPVGRANAEDTEFDVKGLQEGHEYQFRVKAINDEGESEPLETEASIIAKNPYEVTDKPGTPEVVDYGPEHVELKWEAPKKTNGAPVTGYIVEKKEKFSPHWDEVLTTSTPEPKANIPGLKEGSTYQFRVRAINKAGPSEPSDATKPHLSKHRFLKPRINREKLNMVKVRAGENVKFDVDVRGEPPPKITWSFAGKPIETSANYRVDNEDYNTKLVITDTERKLSGVYTIFAENSSGTDEATVEVVILGKPLRPEGPLEVSAVTKEGCKLNWAKPKDDGGLPLTAYLVEKMDIATGRWVPSGRIDPAKTECEITGLEPNHKYQFRVKAANEEGESAPLETDHDTLAKNPYDPPGAPGLPEIDDWNENSVKLKWEAPIRDNGAPVTGYVVEVLDKDTGNFVKALEVPGNQCKATIPKLVEGEQYKFRVKAVNKAGPGEPSEATNWHTAKARFCEFHYTIFSFSCSFSIFSLQRINKKTLLLLFLLLFFFCFKMNFSLFFRSQHTQSTSYEQSKKKLFLHLEIARTVCTMLEHSLT